MNQPRYLVSLRTVTLEELASLNDHISSHFERETRNDGVARFNCVHCPQMLTGELSVSAMLTHAAMHSAENCEDCRHWLQSQETMQRIAAKTNQPDPTLAT